LIDRFYSSLLQEYLELFPVVAVVGPRQVGKSTLVTSPEIGKGRTYQTLDDISLRSVAERDPRAFLDHPGPVTIDEVQLAPGLLRELKLMTDRDRIPGRFLLTGSADLDHCADLSSVLAGRVGVLRLPPITRSEETGTERWRELLGCETVDDLDDHFAGQTAAPFDPDRLLRGGFPPALQAASDRARVLWMDSFRMTYLERDLRRISDIGNLADFDRLMRLSAGISSGLLNQAHLARDAGLSPATAGRHLSVLEASLLIHRLPPYFTNVGKRLVKSPKLFWSDTGLCAHLLGLSLKSDLEAEPLMRGKLFETFVMMEIRALLPLVLPSARLFHLRTHDQLEIDGLIDTGQKKLLFEVKSGRTVTADDALPIERWLKLKPDHGPGLVLYAGEEYRILSPRVRAVPVSLLFG
jgi:predicted AAA+ superfamily ATPase